MSSIYLNHIIGFSSKGLRIFSSESDINKITYRGANFFPIVVLRTSFKVFSSNSNNLFFSTTLASSIRVSPEICLLPRIPNIFEEKSDLRSQNVRIKTNTINSTQNSSLW